MSKLAVVLVFVVAMCSCNAGPVPQFGFGNFGFPPFGNVFTSVGLPTPAFPTFQSFPLGSGVGGFSSSSIIGGSSGGTQQSYLLSSNTVDGKTVIDMIENKNGDVVHKKYELNGQK